MGGRRGGGAARGFRFPAVALLAVLGISGLVWFAPHAEAATASEKDETFSAQRWVMLEIELTSTKPCRTNCFVDERVTARFTPPGSSARPVVTEGFIASKGVSAGQTWLVRFTPTVPGTWRVETKSARGDPGLAIRGTINVGKAAATGHGFLRGDEAHPNAFVFDDGTHFWMLGQTSYELVVNQRFTPANARDAITSAADHGFTKLRVLAFPWSAEPGSDAPETSGPFTDDHSKHESLDQDHFDALDQVVEQARDAGMQIDLELFSDTNAAFFCRDALCPAQRQAVCDKVCSGYGRVGNPVDDRYVRYLVARYAAFTNINWVLTNEFQYSPHSDITVGKAGIAARPSYWNHIGSLVASSDPYFVSTTREGAKRLLSIHTATNLPVPDAGSTLLFPPQGHPWVTNTAFQSGPATTECAPDQFASEPLRSAANRLAELPLVTDEFPYIGVPVHNTGCDDPFVLTADGSRMGLWAIYASGGYASMGDGTPDVSAGSWWPGAPLWKTGNWIDGPQYTSTAHLADFWTSSDRALPYWRMRYDAVNSNPVARRYASSASGDVYVVYSAVPKAIPLTLPQGKRFDVRAFDPTTGEDRPIVNGDAQHVAGTGKPTSWQAPAGIGAAGDWVLYATAATP